MTEVHEEKGPDEKPEEVVLAPLLNLDRLTRAGVLRMTTTAAITRYRGRHYLRIQQALPPVTSHGRPGRTVHVALLPSEILAIEKACARARELLAQLQPEDARPKRNARAAVDDVDPAMPRRPARPAPTTASSHRARLPEVKETT